MSFFTTKHKTASLIMAALMSLSVAGTALADDLEEQLQDLQEKAAQQQEITNEAQARVENLSEKLRVLQEEVDAATSEYNDVKGRLDKVQSDIYENTELLNKTEKELQVKNKKLAKRVRDIYINGQISYVDVLFGAKDFSDFLTRMDILKRIIKHDYDLIMKVKADREIVMNTKAKLEKDKADVELLVADAEIKQKNMLDKKQAQQVLLDKAEYDRDVSQQAYEEIMAASQEITRMIQRSQMVGGSYVAGGSGAMIWPLNGPITSEFGWRTHPIFGTQRYHSGLDIGGDYGLPIVAAASGTVIHAGWISGYGYTVIIDHGGGITTLYGHNESLLVGEGESVSQGQTIAMCGSTGNSTGPHCHFEVRENGEPVSPYSYL
ncbi:Septal ring factor EnvC, activator of murein hydrolases AmiA and AmiB [Anaerovibrio lipolyticus DSM 3074]|uniref:Peptidase M23 n=2 Tax=Anaerovibrio lipolyticus TaxID=82374 RepID=A0A0B2K3R1_9FIRM|nr:M23 family metallopeptidase [Anaerovibrio lipolyticus]KHM52732.1 peptidase M23 [Anaerovibrio lipolyticus]SHI36722.1 Septal ring factor EnvC, activator of murein hydrolases AmiA and AmiB [Anaerovibrio lipolyticus DSM 3074]